jgi:hypothetical protein
MKRLLISSLIAALLIGPSIGFASHVLSFRGGAKYDPPIPADEWQKIRELPISQAHEILQARQKPLTRLDWIQDSVLHSYFWRGVARQSMVPVLGVFIACVFVGRFSKYGHV